MPFETGQTVGDYEFLDLLETLRGCRAYRVRNVLAQRLERLKTFPKELQDDRERVERFLREIKIHARLTHPNIAAFYNATRLEEQLVMTTELLEGGTLADRLEAGPLPMAEAVGYLCQALAALGYAHEQGVVHRMISPAVMTITPGGTLKLTGFDLAKTATDPQLTQAGAVMGTLEYISPEQVKGITTLDARTDIYSVGAVLYAAVTGRGPFYCKTQFDMMLAHVNTPPTPPSEINPAVPAELNSIILKALEKEPSQRFQTAKEFHEALEGVPLTLQGSEAKQQLLPPLEPPGAKDAPQPQKTSFPVFPERTSPHRLSPGLIALALFTFFVVAFAFFCVLKITRL